ncbi:MAG: hypothetical protein J6X47_08160 [Clostridia bacterium]|nr:hypothetical protein [Clostridia bacterium]
MFKKNKKTDIDDALQNVEAADNAVENAAENAENAAETVENAAETVENAAETAEQGTAKKTTVFKTSLDDDEARKGVYIDKEEAERFLEEQRKKKKRKKIIITVVAIVVALVALFIIYKVIFGGNVGHIKWMDKYIVKNDPKTAGEILPNDLGMTVIAEKRNNMGGTTVLKFSPADSLLILEITNSKGEKEEIRSWPAPLPEDTDPATADSEYPKYKVNHDIVSSLVRLGYTASNLDGGKDFGINQVDKVQYVYNRIDDGFKVRYTVPIEVTKTDNMADTYKVYYEFSFAVEFWLDDNGDLIVNVPKKDVKEDKEEKDYTRDSDEMPRVASIACLPFISAARQGDEGYFVTPDGSGGLTYFNVPRISQYDEYQKRIYGYDDIFDVFNYPNMTNEKISMPVFGVVKPGKMLTCYATESEANASVLIGQPGMKNLKFYYVTFVFKWREFYQAKMSQNGAAYTFLEVPSGIGDFTMRYSYQIDSSKDYTYIDVANNTREFLVDKWDADFKSIDYLKDAKVNSYENKRQDPDLINLKIFFADVNQASVRIFTQYKVMTTFAQAKNIVASTSETAPRMRYSLLGWQQGGYFGNIMRKYNIGASVGGKSGLKDLTAYAAENGKDVSADVNMLILYGKPKGASLRQATVKNPGTFYVNYKQVSNAGVFYRNSNNYYMSPLYYDAKMLKKDVKNISKLGFTSVDLQQLGDLLFTDYNKENALLRQQALEYYRKWIVEFQKEFANVSVYYGYEYAASVADNILDIPTETSRLFIIDESIPFVQIVYHGLIDYYSTAINRSSNYTESLLRSIEYGAFFTYEVTKEATEELRYTDYNSLFKAQYDDLSADIMKGYVLAEKVLAPVANATIVDHKCVDDPRNGSIYCTTYSNGIKIYVNYSNENYSAPEGTVPALGVAIVSNGSSEAVKVG